MNEGGEAEGLRKTGGKLVHKGQIVSVREDHFEYPDGTTSTRQVVVHPGSVAIIAHGPWWPLLHTTGSSIP